MSAAHAATGPADVPGVSSGVSSGPAVPPRRLTGKRLYAALLRDTRFKDAVRIHEVVPVGGKEVLAAVCELVADEVGTWTWRPVPTLRGRTVQAVALRMGTYGGHDAIEALLQALVTVGLVERDAGGGLTVPADFAALTRPVDKASGSRNAPPGFVDRGGRPRRGEDPAQRQLRVLTEVGGKPPTETSEETGEVLVEVSDQRVSEVSPQNPETRFSLVSSDSADSAAEEEGLKLSEVQQQQQREVARARETETGVSGNLGGFGALVSAEALLAPEQEAVRVQLLAVDVGGILGVDGSRGRPGAELCAEWLAMPRITPAVVLEVARARRASQDRLVAEGRGTPIGAFDFLDKPLRERAGLPPRERAAVAGGEGPVSLPTDLVRPWMTEADRLQLSVALDSLKAGKAEQLSACLRRMRRAYPRALTELVRHRPELRVALERLPSGVT